MIKIYQQYIELEALNLSSKHSFCIVPVIQEKPNYSNLVPNISILTYKIVYENNSEISKSVYLNCNAILKLFNLTANIPDGERNIRDVVQAADTLDRVNSENIKKKIEEHPPTGYHIDSLQEINFTPVGYCSLKRGKNYILYDGGSIGLIAALYGHPMNSSLNISHGTDQGSRLLMQLQNNRTSPEDIISIKEIFETQIRGQPLTATLTDLIGKNILLGKNVFPNIKE